MGKVADFKLRLKVLNGYLKIDELRFSSLSKKNILI
jgi:hypothetical protein